MNIVTIVQARKNSSRLRNKILLDLLGKPVLIRQIERMSNSNKIGKIVIATTKEKTDNELFDLCKKNNLNCFRGSSLDLLDRHYQCALKNNADIVLKIPSDCPLIDPLIIDQVIEYFFSENYDYCSNLHPNTFPDGMDVEVMTFNALQKAWKNAKKDFEREHTTPYIWERPKEFKIGNFLWKKNKNFSMTHRFTLDYLEDYNFINEVYKKLYKINNNFSLNDIIDLLIKEPQIMKLNSKYAGVNWYRHHIDQLKTVNVNETKFIDE